MAIQGTKAGQEMLEMGETSPLEIIAETFEHEKVRALMLDASCMSGLDLRREVSQSLAGYRERLLQPWTAIEGYSHEAGAHAVK